MQAGARCFQPISRLGFFKGFPVVNSALSSRSKTEGPSPEPSNLKLQLGRGWLGSVFYLKTEGLGAASRVFGAQVRGPGGDPCGTRPSSRWGI